MKKSKFNLTPVAISMAIAFSSGASAQSASTKSVTELNTVTIVGDKTPLFGSSLTGDALNARRFGTNDTASLLDGIPGISLYTGGGVSSLPVINGLADDRLKITVDGMSITAACPNHMNPALSYIDPAALASINVYAGIVPVSQGGDSIGGAIAVRSLPPTFTEPGEGLKTSGNVSVFHRSNGDVNGGSVRTTLSGENFSLGYMGNTVESKSYKDGNGQLVLASAYKVRNNQVNLASRSGTDLYTLSVGWQDIPYQVFPNQAMDMTSNKSLSINAGYLGAFDWGTLEARGFRQKVRHKMDVFDEKQHGTVGAYNPVSSGMPMDTKTVDLGYSVIGTTPLNENQIARLGHEFHRYTLDDWWPGDLPQLLMGPDTFWNINGGRRDRFALFGELDTNVNEKLSTQFGARVEQVSMNTGNVQGYYSTGDVRYDDMTFSTSVANGTVYQADANAFNAKNHKRKDLNIDLTASARYVENANETYDIGFSRKTRSPNLHERYTWSHEAMMAGLMNNWFGDLNSYVGNIDLKPEVAYSVKTSADWHDAERRNWQLKISPFYTYVKDYINAVVDTNNRTTSYNMITGQGYQFANQDAKLYGLDISGKKLLARINGDLTGRASLSYTRGKTTSGDNLYNIMPLNGRLALDHTNGSWSNSVEAVLVSSKDRVSSVRAEQKTSGYALANYRASYKVTQTVRLDAGVDNLFNRYYNLPLGGLYYNQGAVKGPMPAMGRSINLGVSVSF